MEASVCIATFRRPDGLARLLRSLEIQRGAVPAFEVIVVDNDAAGSANSICETFKDRLRLRYVKQPVRGIAQCRNRAVAASDSRFIAFIDDDEEATPDWLAALHREAMRAKADAAFGSVSYRFSGEPPTWIRECRLFKYPDLANGEAVGWYLTRTSNAYVRRASLPDARAPFDVRLGLIGGEDVDLFYRMARTGARFVAATDARTFEFRDASRTTLRWLLRRSFRNGGTLGHVCWQSDGRHKRLGHGAAAVLRSIGFLLRSTAALTRSRAAALSHLLRSAEFLGRAAWSVGIVYPEYRRRA
jgi:succinoglycan biosynthesis protein ExoM